MKLAFILYNFNLGGTEKSLLNLLNNIDDKDIVIFYVNNDGALFNHFNKRYIIKKIFLNYNPTTNSRLDSIICLIREFKFLTALRLTINFITRNWNEIIKKSIIDNDDYKSFDIAVAYAGPHTLLTSFLVSFVEAETKIQWIHFDLNRIFHIQKVNNALYRKIDFFFCVSKDVQNSFCKFYPIYKKKVRVFHNLINENDIIISSQENLNFHYHKSKYILTVSRLTEEKGLLDFVDNFKMISDSIPDINWYIIGDGPLKNDLLFKIKKLGLDFKVYLLGELENPYPYFRNCFIYLQPSKYEGYSVSVLEAKVFNKPLICTLFSGLNEQLKGYTAPTFIINFDNEHLLDDLIHFIECCEETNIDLVLKNNSKINFRKLLAI